MFSLSWGKGFTIKLNDRRILQALVEYAGFPKEAYMDVILTLDKLDKRGKDGVVEELVAKGFDQQHIDTFMSTLELLEIGGLAKVAELELSVEGAKNVRDIYFCFRLSF